MSVRPTETTSFEDMLPDPTPAQAACLAFIRANGFREPIKLLPMHGRPPATLDIDALIEVTLAIKMRHQLEVAERRLVRVRALLDRYESEGLMTEAGLAAQVREAVA